MSWWLCCFGWPIRVQWCWTGATVKLDIRVESTVTGRYMHAVLSTRPHAEDLVQAPFRHLVASLYGLG